jgi:hypothetical protein
MKAALVSPQQRTVEVVDVTSMDDVIGLVGYETIESDEVSDNGDRLYFDEECFIRGTSGRFRLDKLMPVAGNAVIIGTAADGESLADLASDIDDLRRRISFE